MACGGSAGSPAMARYSGAAGRGALTVTETAATVTAGSVTAGVVTTGVATAGAVLTSGIVVVVPVVEPLPSGTTGFVPPPVLGSTGPPPFVAETANCTTPAS